MIASVLRIVIPEAETLTSLKHCEKEVVRRYNETPGLLDTMLWCRTYIGYADVQVVFIWQSLRDMDKFRGGDLLQAIKEKHQYVITPDQSFGCYDVVSWKGAGK